MFAQCKSPPIFQHDRLQNSIALIFVHSTPPIIETFLCFLSFHKRLELIGACTVLGPQKVYPGRSTDGVLVKLPLPCPLAGSPLKAVAFQFLPLIGIGLFLKNKLQTVFSLVDFGLTSGECPASKLGAAAQFLNALAYTADVGVVVGKQIGGVRLAFCPSAMTAPYLL